MSLGAIGHRSGQINKFLEFEEASRASNGRLWLFAREAQTWTSVLEIPGRLAKGNAPPCGRRRLTYFAGLWRSVLPNRRAWPIVSWRSRLPWSAIPSRRSDLPPKGFESSFDPSSSPTSLDKLMMACVAAAAMSACCTVPDPQANEPLAFTWTSGALMRVPQVA
jgi:hypothetical protein